MPIEKIDYAALLSDLEAKKAALEASIATLKSAMALGVLGQAAEGLDLSSASASSPIENGVPVELPHHAFLGASVPSAIKTYLQVVKKKQTIKEIATALKEHGMESTSDSFEGVVTGALNRLKVAGEVLRFKEGWGLSAWYPASFRSQVNTTKPARKGKKRTAKKKQQPEVQANSEHSKPSVPNQIAELLTKKKGTPLSAEQIKQELGGQVRGLHMILGGMVLRKAIMKTESGMYSAPLSNITEMTAVV